MKNCAEGKTIKSGKSEFNWKEKQEMSGQPMEQKVLKINQPCKIPWNLQKNLSFAD